MVPIAILVFQIGFQKRTAKELSAKHANQTNTDVTVVTVPNVTHTIRSPSAKTMHGTTRTCTNGIYAQ